MQVEIVEFQQTPVAAVEHRGAPAGLAQSAARLIAWRRANNVPPSAENRTFGLHYNDPRNTPADQYQVDLCVAWPEAVAENPWGVVARIIPGGRCARVRHHGPREDIAAARWLCDSWLPASGERFTGGPLIVHYVNVGPEIEPSEMITDIYLPLA